MTRTHKEVTPACLGPDGSAGKVERALRVVSGRWKLAIVFNLFAAPRLHFHELEKNLAGVRLVALIERLGGPIVRSSIQIMRRRMCRRVRVEM